MKTLNPAVVRVPERLYYPLEMIRTCVRWYVSYAPSRRNPEEMMAERGIPVDHSTVHRWCPQAAGGAGQSVSPPQTPHRKELARRRDLHKGQGRMEILVLCRRQGRLHHRLSTAGPSG